MHLGGQNYHPKNAPHPAGATSIRPPAVVDGAHEDRTGYEVMQQGHVDQMMAGIVAWAPEICAYI